MPEPTIIYQPVHSAEATAEIVEAAFALANDTTSDPALFPVVFGKAVDLLSARTVLQQAPQATPPAIATAAA